MVRGFVAVTLVSVAACGGLFVSNIVERRATIDEQYQVWSAFLNSEHLENAHDYSSTCLVVIRDRTTQAPLGQAASVSTLKAWLFLLGTHPPIEATRPDTFSSFRRRNLWREPIHRYLTLLARYGLATDEEAASFGDVERFDRRFPGNCGLVALSAVGFSADGTEAFFKEEHYCELCGGGGFVLMRKQGTTWRVMEHRRGWAS